MNICSTTYMVTGKSRDVESLHQTLIRMNDNPVPIKENDWHYPNMWLGCLVAALGGKTEEVECGGVIIGFSMGDDGVLSIDVDSNSTEMAETRHFIESCFDGMKIFYLETSDGDTYYTNDSKKRFFKHRVYIDTEELLGEDGYFATIKAAAEAVSRLVGKKVRPTSNAVINALEMHREEDEDFWYEYHVYKVVDD